MVFKRLKHFNSKFNTKKCHIFQCNIVFLRSISSVKDISANPEKVNKVKDLAGSQLLKESTFFPRFDITS